MVAWRNYLLDHYAEQLAEIERAIAADDGVVGRYHRIFKDVDEDLFFYIASRTCELPVSMAELVPDWPPEAVRRQSTADTPLMISMLEALTFWNAVKRNSLKILRREIAELRVADYGAGWGRIARLSCRDVPEDQFLAFEPNPGFVEYYRSCRLPGRIIQTDWGSSSPLTCCDAFDVVYCFSILTHASDALTRRIKDRWIELTKPGSLVFATIRPQFFLAGGEGDAGYLSDTPLSEIMLQYHRGELVFRRYADGSGDWGVTVMSPEYASRVFGEEFSVIRYGPIPTTANQMIMILQRK
jgi:hypothetical protein